MLRRRFTYSNVVATLALVFAMSGGAYAASKFLITSTKQIKPSVLAQLKGKAGAAGVPGAAGPQGPAGPQGAAGANGKDGAAGKDGAQGEKGLQGEPGKTGKEGKEGSPWTAGGVLPSGKTETGTWAFDSKTGTSQSAISFPIPLATQQCEIEPGPPPIFAQQAICADHVHVFQEAEKIPAGCTGTVVELAGEKLVTELGAEPGNFCLWIQFTSAPIIRIHDVETGATEGVGRSGAVTLAQGSGLGTWAVTAP
jgi:hypothetical protein